MDVANGLVTFALSVWPRPPQILPQTPTVSLSVYETHLYGRCHTCFTKSFSVVTS